ncbi:general secretion pathway protein GspK [Marinobacterium mangrovicola]|uniref:General secretion pathway protein K n=1 Tax=Marinobacterium mangrovicola TaxID=1476959 RepID=A0A4V2PEE1_9GAMM|nr:type II secretion system protein GspK [Marinobacterium mangrovicola]TCK08766.1 general secretion pathway protein K [Marinobacterium mangrovicola]
MPFALTDSGNSVYRLTQQGVVLVTVLWVLVLLSLIATNLSLGGRGFARQTLNTEQAYKASQAADAGLVWALWSLQQQDPYGWLADGSEHNMEIGGTEVRVSLQDESGKLDLNVLPTELLDALIEPAMEDDSQRAALVAAIEDWRDEDDLIRLNGAEEDEYLAAGRSEGPANQPFKEVAELANVLGMTVEVYRQIQPSLTVRTQARTINPTVAPFEVLMTLPNASEGIVRSYIDQRRTAWESQLPLPELPFDGEPYVADGRSGREFSATIEAVIEPYTRVRQIVNIARGGQVPRVERERVLLLGSNDQTEREVAGNER